MSPTTPAVSRCGEMPATYRLNASNIDLDYLRKHISSYLPGASVRGTQREDGQEYYLYDADRPLLPSEVRDIMVDSSEFMEALQQRPNHRRNLSGGSRGRRSRGPRGVPVNPAVFQVTFNIMPNQNSPTISFDHTAGPGVADQAHRLDINVRSPAPLYSPGPSQQPQQQQQPSPIAPLRQPSAIFTPAGTPSPSTTGPEFFHPKPLLPNVNALNCRAASAHSWSSVSACSTPKTL